MTTNSDKLRRCLSRWLRPLGATPLHPQWLASRLGKKKGLWVAEKAQGRVLDIGCADRSIRSNLAKAKSYIGLDYPATACDLYGTRPDVYGDAGKLPFGEAVFDSVLLLDVLEHVAAPEVALSEALRVLRSGGCLLLTIPFAYPLHDQPHDYQRFTEHGLVCRLGRVGFTRVTIQEAGGGMEAAAIGMTLSLAQGSIEAISARSWRMLFVPLALLLLPVVNIVAWLFSFVLPAPRLLPSAYYVQAYRI